MGIVWFYGALLLVAYAAPALLTLSVYTYGFTTLAHFVTFFISVILFVMMGKSLQKRHRPRFGAGLATGALVAMIGTAVGQVIRHLPIAQRAFMAQLPGVPQAAALTMLQLHAVTGAILSGAIFAVLFGLLGAIATWWGGRQRPLMPTPENRDHEAS